MAQNRYYIDVRHEGLGRFQRIQGPDATLVKRRAEARAAEWNRLWERRQEAGEARARRARDKARSDERKGEAEEATRVAEAAVVSVEQLLAHALSVDDRVDFEALKLPPFPEPPPEVPRLTPLPAEPEPIVSEVQPYPVSYWASVVERFSAKARETRLALEQEDAARERAHVAERNAARVAAWRAETTRIAAENASRQAAHARSLSDWAQRKRAYETRQAATNSAVEDLRRRYLAGEADAIEQYCDLVLSASVYPERFPQRFALQFDPASRILAVEYVLPLPEHLPRVKSVRYIAARDELVESVLPDATRKALYDSALYQLALRTLHELFEADGIDALSAVAFIGVVEKTDPATGKEVRPCILTVQATKVEFQQITLARVDPKDCFRRLRGVGSSQLHALVPVAPVVRFRTDDARFIDGRTVLDGVEEGANLATMDWGDFEHLIRDLFEREFVAGGAEVKVTRASRDGGVDAVVFDPDPIRGGIFLIQAKRYTNVVGVSAVRELYGAMTGERAARGILVTTSTFGPDSYAFAKDKPITLLDGGGLLHLLQKHGVDARIDLNEARAARLSD